MKVLSAGVDAGDICWSKAAAAAAAAALLWLLAADELAQLLDETELLGEDMFDWVLDSVDLLLAPGVPKPSAAAALRKILLYE